MAIESELHKKNSLWMERPVTETLDLYADWAANYDGDLAKAVYCTPSRIAAALIKVTARDAKVLDFGCGTGLSGKAMQSAGFSNLEGVDVSAGMLEKAQVCGVYQKVWLGQPGKMVGVTLGQYEVIVAVGVVSLGAAPPETLSMIIDYMAPNGLIGLSFNDPTIANGSYDIVLDKEILHGRVCVISREYGPHLSEPHMGSDVILLRRL